VTLGRRKFLDGGVQGHCQLVYAVGEHNLSGKQMFVLIAELDMVFDQERHQAFQSIQPGFA